MDDTPAWALEDNALPLSAIISKEEILERACIICGTMFIPVIDHTKTCGQECSTKNERVNSVRAAKAWRTNNLERARSHSRAGKFRARSADLEKAREQSREEKKLWREQNREKYNAYMRAYRLKKHK